VAQAVEFQEARLLVDVDFPVEPRSLEIGFRSLLHLEPVLGDEHALS
jgi:hypothetical protein